MGKKTEDKHQALPHPRMWAAIVCLAQLREKAKLDDADLVKARKKLEEDLNRMGDGPQTITTPEWRTVAANLTLVERAIERARSDRNHYADKFEEAVKKAVQGSLFSDEEFNTLEDHRADEHAPLFQQALEAAAAAGAVVGEDGDDEDEDGPGADDAGDEAGGIGAAPSPLDVTVLRVKEKMPPTRLGPDGLPEREDALEVQIEAIAMRPTAKKALQEAGLMTLNDFNRFMVEAKGEVDRIKGVTEKDVEALVKRMEQARREHAERQPRRHGDDRLDRVRIADVEGLSSGEIERLEAARIRTLGEAAIELLTKPGLLIEIAGSEGAGAVTAAMAEARARYDDAQPGGAEANAREVAARGNGKKPGGKGRGKKAAAAT